MPANQTDGVDRVALVGGALCLDFINTRHNVDRTGAPDEILTYEDWIGWSRRTGAISSELASRLAARATAEPDQADQALSEVYRVRDTVFRLVAAVATGSEPAAEHVEAVRDAWATAVRHGQLVRRNGSFAWGWDEDSDNLSRPLWPVVDSAISLLTSPEIDRVRRCGGDDCSWLFLDRSKNGRRRWCQMDVCGNRAKARRHYAKRRTAEA